MGHRADLRWITVGGEELKVQVVLQRLRQGWRLRAVQVVAAIPADNPASVDRHEVAATIRLLHHIVPHHRHREVTRHHILPLHRIAHLHHQAAGAVVAVVVAAVAAAEAVVVHGVTNCGVEHERFKEIFS